MIFFLRNKNRRKLLILFEMVTLLGFLCQQTSIQGVEGGRVYRSHSGSSSGANMHTNPSTTNPVPTVTVGQGHGTATVPQPLPGGPLPYTLIPRFKIPRGNLSYYQNPQWEILYFLRHGIFPPSEDTDRKRTNDTKFMDKLQRMKNVLDKNLALDLDLNLGRIKTEEYSYPAFKNQINDLDQGESLRDNFKYSHEGFPEIDPEGFLSQGTFPFTPSYEEALLDDPDQADKSIWGLSDIYTSSDPNENQDKSVKFKDNKPPSPTTQALRSFYGRHLQPFFPRGRKSKSSSEIEISSGNSGGGGNDASTSTTTNSPIDGESDDLEREPLFGKLVYRRSPETGYLHASNFKVRGEGPGPGPDSLKIYRFLSSNGNVDPRPIYEDESPLTILKKYLMQRDVIWFPPFADQLQLQQKERNKNQNQDQDQQYRTYQHQHQRQSQGLSQSHGQKGQGRGPGSSSSSGSGVKSLRSAGSSSGPGGMDNSAGSGGGGGGGDVRDPGRKFQTQGW